MWVRVPLCVLLMWVACLSSLKDNPKSATCKGTRRWRARLQTAALSMLFGSSSATAQQCPHFGNNNDGGFLEASEAVQAVQAEPSALTLATTTLDSPPPPLFSSTFWVCSSSSRRTMPAVKMKYVGRFQGMVQSTGPLIPPALVKAVEKCTVSKRANAQCPRAGFSSHRPTTSLSVCRRMGTPRTALHSPCNPSARCPCCAAAPCPWQCQRRCEARPCNQ